MLKFNKTTTKQVIEKYKWSVLKDMAEPSFEYMEDNRQHTMFLTQCSSGNKEAKEYVIQKIRESLDDKVTPNDKKIVLEEISKEISSFQNKQYEKFDLKSFSDNQERRISYYQLIELSASQKQYHTLNNYAKRLEDKELAIEILANEIYKQEYGIGVIDDIFEMRLNNIEVHDINKIRVEVADGNWYTISDLKVERSELVRMYARRLLSQNSGGDLTDDDCERESSLEDGSRVTVALKPASATDTIFIKKFDNFTITPEEMLENGTVTKEAIEDMKILGKGRSNQVTIGGVNTGKSTFLKMYIGLLPKELKIGLVDPSKDTDLITLYPERDIVILYETPHYSMNDQFMKLLRMNRQILGISEARSCEVEQAIKGMLRGNSGSFLTLHTTRAADVVDNIAWMCLESGMPQDIRVLRSRIASAVDIIYRIKHFPNGARRLDEMSELIPTGDLENPFKVVKIHEWDYKTNRLVRNKDYKPSEELIDKLRYYGCSEEEIERFSNGKYDI